MSRAEAIALAFASTLLVCGACGGKDDTAAPTDTDGQINMNCDENPLRWSCDNSTVATFFELYCFRCHDTPPNDFSNYGDVFDKGETIRCGVTPGPESLERCSSDPQPGQFPDGDGPFPTPDERDDVVAWIEMGAPE